MEAEIKRSRKDMQACLRDMLEVVDSLDRVCERLAKAADAGQVEERLKGNIEATRRLTLQKLKRNGVSPMQLVGTVLDPHLAEVEDYEIREDLDDETVLEEIVKGYMWNTEILRPGRVILSKQA